MSGPDKVTAGASAVIDKVAQNIYRNSLKYWFLRYGYLKAIDGTITEHPNLKLQHVQQLIFDHHDACLVAKKPCLQIILKARKGGASTGVQAATYFRTRKFANREAAIMGDIAGTSDTVYEIYRRFAEHDKFDWGDGFGNLRADDKEHNLTDDIVLPNGSSYKKVTAGSSNANRSGTIQVGNATEVSRFPQSTERDPLTGFLGSWHDSGEASYMALDSTSAGPFGKYYEFYMDERNGYHKIFSAWFQEPTYRKKFPSVEDEAKLIRDIRADRDDMEMMQRFSLDWEQMHWIRDKFLNKCGASREKLNQEYPNTVEEAFLSKSALRFNIHVLENMRRAAVVHPPRTGDFVTQDNGSASFIPATQGDVKIFEEPQVNHRYIGAFDPCAGEDQQAKGQTANPDWHSVGILRDSFIDTRNGCHFPPKIVAHYHSRADVSVACDAAAAMSRFYGKCLFVVETNGVGLYPVKRLAELEIPLWSRQVPGKTQGQKEKQDGWNSNPTNRQTIIDALGAFIEKWKPEDPTFEVFDVEIVEELKKFVTRNGIDAAMPGFHDDTVMMLAMILYLRANATVFLEPKPPRVNFEKLMLRQGWKLQPAYHPQG